MNVGLSVSRVGSAAQTKAMKKVAGKLRLELAQFRELAAFAQFGADLDEATQKQIERGKRLTEILKQTDLAPVPFEEAVAVIYVATAGLLDNVPVERIQAVAVKFVEYVKNHTPKVFEEIRKTRELSETTERELATSIAEVKKLS